MKKPVYVIRPKTTWEVFEVRSDEENLILFAATETQAMKELRQYLRDEAS